MFVIRARSKINSNKKKYLGIIKFFLKNQEDFQM